MGRMNRREKKILLIVTFLTVCFAVIAYLVVSDKVSWFDVPIIYYIQGLESTSLTPIMFFFTLIGSKFIVAPLSIIILLVLYIQKKQLSELLFFAIASLGSEFLNIILKLVFQRVRPIEHRLVEETGYSFPSGHSMAAFTLYVLIAYFLFHRSKTFKMRIVVISFVSLLIFAVGLSRIYLGVHFPSDIIGGYLASGIWFLLSFSLLRTVQEV